MEMVGHGDGKTTIQITLAFTQTDGLINGLPDCWDGKLIYPTSMTADCDEIDIALRVACIERDSVMWKFLATDRFHRNIG